MKISFLIPSKNRLELLRHAITSILAQDDQDIEIIVSDNASQEDYKSYIDELNDDRIVYSKLSAPASVTKNWQNALSLCTGDYVLMLGDDDAIVPDFSKRLRPFLSDDGPDILYLAAFHYAYPGVLDFRLDGYLAVVRNAEFLIGDADPFSLTKEYMRDLAESVLSFRYRFGFNAQHFLLKAAFVKQFAAQGGIYQSPYPDTFAAVVTLSHAGSCVVIPKESVIIGISPQSFGAFYFSNRHDEGYAFLANGEEDAALRKLLNDEMLPGDRNNTNWLVAAEASKRLTGTMQSISVNICRYRALQIKSVMYERYLLNRSSNNVVEELNSKLTPAEKAIFELLDTAIDVVARLDRVVLTEIFTELERKLGQFTKARIKFLDIGPHRDVRDALAWLARPEGEIAEELTVVAEPERDA